MVITLNVYIDSRYNQLMKDYINLEQYLVIKYYVINY